MESPWAHFRMPNIQKTAAGMPGVSRQGCQQASGCLLSQCTAGIGGKVAKKARIFFPLIIMSAYSIWW